MHISPLRLLLGAALLASAAAAAAVAVTRPREAGAQQGFARPGRFQVAALLGSPGAWVILDTESGDFEHWRTDATGAMSVVRTRYASRTGSTRTVRLDRGELAPSSAQPPAQRPPSAAPAATPPLKRTPP